MEVLDTIMGQEAQNPEEGAEVEIEELLNKIEDVWDIVYDNGTTFFIKKDKSFRCNNWKSFKEKLLSDVLEKSDEKEAKK